MAKKALDVVEKGELKFFPDFHAVTWNRWLTEIK